MYLTRDSNLAEEITQETFVSAWTNIASYKARASFGTWLHQIAYRKFVDSRRALRRDASLMAKLREQINEPQDELDPFYLLAADEHSRMLYEVLNTLPSLEYIVIVLHYIQGLSFREMSKVLDEPVGTVKWQTNRALKKLRGYLSGRVEP
jgi:RNA polymerase sigma-70 factor (ECF subfamily)